MKKNIFCGIYKIIKNSTNNQFFVFKLNFNNCNLQQSFLFSGTIIINYNFYIFQNINNFNKINLNLTFFSCLLFTISLIFVN